MRLAHARTGFVAPVVVLSFAAAAAAPAFAVSGDQIVATARQYLGRPYKFGASMSEAPARMDCSSFTKYVFGRYGIYLLRASYEQINQGAHVNLGAHRAGDLLFFKTSANGHVTNHVGICTGDNRIIHTYGSPGVCFSSFAAGQFWRNHLVAIRRLPGVTTSAGGGAPNESPVGSFDAILNGWAYGWALDRNTATQGVYIHVYIDGPAGGGGTHIGTVLANQYRPDVNRALGLPGNHGFAYPIPVQFHNQPHRLWIYALDTWGGVNPLLPGSPRAF